MLNINNLVATPFNGNLDQALDANSKHLYVQNKIKQRATLLIDLKDSDGKIHTVKFPKTFVPIDILDFIDREAARKSTSLRTYIRKGVLRILESESAEKIANSSEGIKEAQRAGLIGESNIEKVEILDTTEQVNPKDDTSSDVEFFKNIGNELSVAVDEDEAYKKVGELVSFYYSDCEEYLKNNNITIVLKGISQTLKEMKFTRAQEEVEKLVSFILNPNASK